MTTIYCSCSYCLNNKKGKCTAHGIQIIKGGKCKSFEGIKSSMKTYGVLTKNKGAFKKREVGILK